jgi:Homeodomain-like domain
LKGIQLVLGVEMMGVMTAQPPLPVTPSGGVPFGAVAALVQDHEGGRVFIRSELCFVWDAGDEAGRRLAAVQLVRIKAASLVDVAAAFEVAPVTLWRWRKELDASGAAGLAPDKPGPKGPSRLTDDMAADIRGRRSGGGTLQAVADAVGVSVTTVRRALAAPAAGPPGRNKTRRRPQPWTCRYCRLRPTAARTGPPPGGDS